MTQPNALVAVLTPTQRRMLKRLVRRDLNARRDEYGGTGYSEGDLKDLEGVLQGAAAADPKSAEATIVAIVDVVQNWMFGDIRSEPAMRAINTLLRQHSGEEA